MAAPPSKREWIEAFLDGLQESGYTGFVDLRLTYNGGGISRVIPMKQEPVDLTAPPRRRAPERKG